MFPLPPKRLDQDREADPGFELDARGSDSGPRFTLKVKPRVKGARAAAAARSQGDEEAKPLPPRPARAHGQATLSLFREAGKDRAPDAGPPPTRRRGRSRAERSARADALDRRGEGGVLGPHGTCSRRGSVPVRDRCWNQPPRPPPFKSRGVIGPKSHNPLRSHWTAFRTPT